MRVHTTVLHQHGLLIKTSCQCCKKKKIKTSCLLLSILLLSYICLNLIVSIPTNDINANFPAKKKANDINTKLFSLLVT